MKLIRYGITLKRLTRDDLELLRTWRNSQQINQFMEYREYITPEMQETWFESIDNPDNNYYIIIYKGEKIGLINEKGFSRFADKTSESGIFLGSEKYINSPIPVLASLILLEMSFFLLGGKDSYIRILKGNTTSIKFNRQLGYQLCPGQDEIENQRYVLTRESFITKTYKLRKAALRLSGDPNMYVVWEPHDYESGMAQESEELFAKSELHSDDKWEDGCHIFWSPIDVENPYIRDVDPEGQTPYKYYKKRL
ncbi:MAG: GNAT family N-acetyltransferase [Bacteroidales bacterium]|nr:GNAT family N-acetyltransferase [Bacteroidales bacterium]MCF8455836.1 GNAT family N-acetyltransferase [Bacteroidales bacterium]